MCSKNNNTDGTMPLNESNKVKKPNEKSVTIFRNDTNNTCCPSMERLLYQKPSKRLTLILILCFAILYGINISTLPSIYDNKSYKQLNNLVDTSYISTIKEKLNEGDPFEEETPNFYEMLISPESNLCTEKSLLPTKCSKCLRKKDVGGNCNLCDISCECYCKYLCRIKPKPKFVKKYLYASPPLLKKDSNRLVPRIVHQTWFEDPGDKEKYPNLSRVRESWRQSGWEYHFYDDEAISKFLSTHFPSEVLEAYNAIVPGSFKADLFRYCVLFIHGGVYADVDVLLQSNLDVAISDDIGFMLPFDKPGRQFGRGACVWNGLIASAPAHPFLANAIQLVVNNIRNRFTNIDVDNLLCPNPELSTSHAFDILFTAGPCILGIAINQVLQRDPQTQYIDGDLHEPNYNILEITTTPTTSKSSIIKIPGRSIILHQNKTDMGMHRFTMIHKNLIIASTDLPVIMQMFKQNEDKPHYSKMHAKYGHIYGLHNNVYIDQVKSNDVIEIHIVAPNAINAWFQRLHKRIILLLFDSFGIMQGLLLLGFFFFGSACYYCSRNKGYKLRYIAW